MSNLAVTNTFVAGTLAKAADVNTNFSDIVTYVNNRNSGSASWDVLLVAGATTLSGTATLGSTLSVSGASTLQSALTITPTTNQIVLGTTRTVTLTAPTPASASRAVTVPDLGGDYSIVGSIANQNISGVKNFTGNINFADGTEAAPAVALASDTKTGIGSLHIRSISFITQNGSGNGTEAFWINGSQQIIAAQNGTAAIPAYSFSRDGGAGLACQLADAVDLIAGTTMTSRLFKTTTSDSDYRTLSNLYYGGNSCYTSFTGQTTTAITTAKEILTVNEFLCEVWVSGNDGTNFFADKVMTGFSKTTPAVLSSTTIIGSPTARTYTMASNTSLKLAMASGTYVVNAFAIQVKAR